MLKLGVNTFFNPKAFASPVDKASQKILSQFGAYTCGVAKRLIKTKPADQHSSGGNAPYGHEGTTRYKDFIFFFYDASKKTVVMGAVLLPRKDQQKVPQTLERGGVATITQFEGGHLKAKTVRYEPRPHMQTAFDIVVKKFLPKLIEGSIVP